VPDLVVKPLPITVAAALLALPGAAGAQPAPEPEAARGARWSLMLGGGALAPVGEMRDGYQDGLVAGLRFGVRSRLGLGVQLAADYSPLPRRSQPNETIDTAYGTLAVVPAWTIGRGVVRVQLGAGGGLAIEHASITPADNAPAMTDDVVTAAALAQIGLELHVTRGGGLVLLGGATRTFGELEYQYAWGIGGLTLEF
jgi:hypothetical protein